MRVPGSEASASKADPFNLVKAFSVSVQAQRTTMQAVWLVGSRDCLKQLDLRMTNLEKRSGHNHSFRCAGAKHQYDLWLFVVAVSLSLL